MSFTKTFLALAILIFGICSSSVSQISVLNVDFHTTHDNRIEISYDLIARSSSRFTVWVEVSLDNGRSFTLIPGALTGDVGENVQPGRNKKIIWDVFKDTPVLISENLVIAVLAKETLSSISDDPATANGLVPDMVFVKGGKFLMGSNDGRVDEMPVHEVYLSDFYISKYEVTNAQYCLFLNEKGNQTEGGASWLDIKSRYCQIEKQLSRYVPKPGYESYPVVWVTWYGARAYCKWIGGRLPTEAEWEYAARGGNRSKGYKYSGSDHLDDVAWYWDNSKNAMNAISEGKGTHPVGQKKPNELGLYDMTGNVWEWCADWWDENYYQNSPVRNPKGPSSGIKRALRGGSWINRSGCRISYRLSHVPDHCCSHDGFRVVRDSLY